MKYYVVADIHSYYTAFIKALESKGYFTDTEPHKLIICGDLFDRGDEAEEMQNFVLKALASDEVILIRGNHEDLYIKLLDDFPNYYTNIDASIHKRNGTFDTAKQLTNHYGDYYLFHPDDMLKDMKNVPFVKEISPKMVNYYETKHYIFTHGFVPCTYIGDKRYVYKSDWKKATKKEWEQARWYNGMDCALSIGIKNKTVVCGHWNASYGHCRIERKCGTEYGSDADFTPYYGNGIIAIDACTSISGFVNCIVLEDEDK